LLSVTIIHDMEGLLGLRDGWNELLRDSASDCLFLTWEWLATWWKHLSGDRRLFVVVVRSGPTLAAIAPLAIRPPAISAILPFPSLEFLGTGSVGSDYLDIIIRRGLEREALDALSVCLADRNCMIEMGQIPMSASAALELGRTLGRRRWSHSVEEANVSHYITLSGHTWDSYLASLSREHRYNFRRRLRQLQAVYDVRFETVRSETGRREALVRLIGLHKARWQEHGLSNAFHTPGMLRFHEELTRLACERGWLRLATLSLDGEPVAGLYGFRYRNVFYFYQSGFDPAYAKHSVGLVTMGLTIRGAIEEGVEEFDMLRGVEDYKRHWARETRSLARLEIYPPDLRGMVYRRAMELRRAARRAARSVLPRVLAHKLATRERSVGGG
jgi:CelD/BcsL family acetyltransferase involved in cellulose biosynthesis